MKKVKDFINFIKELGFWKIFRVVGILWFIYVLIDITFYGGDLAILNQVLLIILVISSVLQDLLRSIENRNKPNDMSD